MVWSNPDTGKVTARYLCIHPTTKPLHQGTGNDGKTRQVELFAKWSTKEEDSFSLFISSIPK